MKFICGGIVLLIYVFFDTILIKMRKALFEFLLLYDEINCISPAAAMILEYKS